MSDLEIFVPVPTITPEKVAKYTWLNSNHRLHWAPKGKITKAWRSAALQASQSVERTEPYQGRVHVTMTVHKPRGGRYDVANLYPVIKACLDGVVDAKTILIDDSNKYVEGPDPRHGGPSKDSPGVLITIKEI